MCKHGKCLWINDIKVCTKCGMTVMPNGKVMFDRDIVNTPKKRKKGH